MLDDGGGARRGVGGKGAGGVELREYPVQVKIKLESACHHRPP